MNPTARKHDQESHKCWLLFIFINNCNMSSLSSLGSWRICNKGSFLDRARCIHLLSAWIMTHYNWYLPITMQDHTKSGLSSGKQVRRACHRWYARISKRILYGEYRHLRRCENLNYINSEDLQVLSEFCSWKCN